MSLNLASLRQEIDQLDHKLIALLNERAQISLDIGTAKRQGSDPQEDENTHVYIPGREKQVFEKIAKLNPGPLPNENLHAIYREIMSASIALQKDVMVAYLGPIGSFSHDASMKRFGDSVQYASQGTIADVFEAVERGRCQYGVVPFENSIAGSVVPTLDKFVKSKVKIRAETYLPVHHYLLSNATTESIRRVYSHPVALAQCQTFLNSHLKGIELVPCASTSEAAQLASKEKFAAAICNRVCSEIYGLDVLHADIEDQQDNTTRFFIISDAWDGPSASDKTLLMFTVDHRLPGALCDGLKVFKDHNLNLTKIDSRPSLLKPWHYVFFVECAGVHGASEVMGKVIEELQKYCLDVKIVGTYPDQRPQDLGS
ncbi:MAG: Prephenate dehydratase-domain-containing protein [Benniella sp.]|nr:MAG: Prephenate dehydratase-domain-containing protein [Benniella sp.]